MNPDMKTALEAAGTALGLHDPVAYPPEQTTSHWALRWRRDDGKYAQVKVLEEDFITRGEDVTPETTTAEVKRLIEAGELEVLD